MTIASGLGLPNWSFFDSPIKRKKRREYIDSNDQVFFPSVTESIKTISWMGGDYTDIPVSVRQSANKRRSFIGFAYKDRISVPPTYVSLKTVGWMGGDYIDMPVSVRQAVSRRERYNLYAQSKFSSLTEFMAKSIDWATIQSVGGSWITTQGVYDNN